MIQIYHKSHRRNTSTLAKLRKLGTEASQLKKGRESIPQTFSDCRLSRISAIIKDGSLLQAQLYSFGVNKTHGLRRSNEDKRRAVEAALTHEKGENSAIELSVIIAG